MIVDRDLSLPGATPRCLTYEEVRHTAAGFGRRYLEAGLRPGDPVAFLTLNRAELAVAVLGALRVGLVAVPLNFLLTPTELGSAIKRAEAKALVTDREAIAGREPSDVEHLFLLEDDVAARDPGAPAAHVDPEDPALIFFTSGTTGEPKGATISHRALGSVLGRYARIGSLLPTPRHHLALLVMPLAHAGGLVSLLVSTALGIPSLILSRFEPRRVLETIEDARPTIFAGSPAMYRLLLGAGAEGYDLSSIRIWGGGADAFDRELLDHMRALGGWRRFGVRFRPFTMIGYGAAETVGQATMSPPVPVGDRCIGWVLPGFDHRVVNDEGEDVGRHGTGELLLRGGSVMSGYWDDPEPTTGSMSDGWFHTGDIVRRGRAGLLYYESRRKDVITSGGYSIAAREIEAVLEGHGAVVHAAAVGLPDPIRGERAVAAVVLHADRPDTTPDELEAWAAERLASYKRPRRIFVLDHLPVSATFKPRKGELRERLLSLEHGDR